MRVARKIRRIPKVLFVVIGLTSFYLIFLYAANYRESVLIELYDDETDFEPQTEHLELSKRTTKFQIELERSNEVKNKIKDLEQLFKKDEQLEKKSQYIVTENIISMTPYKTIQFITKFYEKEYEKSNNDLLEQPEEKERWDHEKEAMADKRVIIERTTPEQTGINEQPIEIEKSGIEKEMEKYLNTTEKVEDFEQLKKFEQPDAEVSKEIVKVLNNIDLQEQPQLEQPDEHGVEEQNMKNIERKMHEIVDENWGELEHFDDDEINNKNIDNNLELNENIADNDEERNHENQENVEHIDDNFEVNHENDKVIANIEHNINDDKNINFEEKLYINNDKPNLEETSYRSRKIYDGSNNLNDENLEQQTNNNYEYLDIRTSTIKNNIFNLKDSLQFYLSNGKKNKEQNEIHSNHILQEYNNNDITLLQNRVEPLELKLMRSLDNFIGEDGTRTTLSNERILEASATNRTSVLSNLLIYNRVPKCGSTTFKTLLEKLSTKNHFIYESSKIFGDRFLQGKREQEFADILMQKQSKSNLPFSMDRHVCFVDFKKYGYPQPTYINVIRDPIEKFVSTFYYIRSKKRWKNLLKGKHSPSDLQNLLNYHKDTMPPEAYKQGKLMMPFDWWMNKNLSECVLSGDKECKYESGISKETTVAFLCGGEPHCRIVNGVSAIQQAKYNVETQYSVVGIVEQIEETMAVMEHYIPRYLAGITKTYKSLDSKYRQGNKTPHPDPPDKVREILLNNLVGDIEIYNFAKQKLYLQYKHIQNMSNKN